MVKKIYSLLVFAILCDIANGADITRILFFNYDTHNSWYVHLYDDKTALRGYETQQEIKAHQVSKRLATATDLTDAVTSITNVTRGSDTLHFYFSYLNSTRNDLELIDLEKLDTHTIEAETKKILTNRTQLNKIIEALKNKKLIPNNIPYLVTCIGTKITQPWPQRGDKTSLHFYDKDQDFYCFANTFTNGSQDPKIAVKKDFTYQIDQQDWISTEHYFQAQKFNDPAAAYQQMKDDTITLGQLPKKVNDTKYPWKTAKIPSNDWYAKNIYVMLKAVRAKFSQHDELKKTLVDTVPLVLVEDTNKASYDEEMWGAGKTYTGCNQLGQVLMHVRQELVDKKLYTFKKGDARFYDDLLKGVTPWEVDNNPDKTYIPDGYLPNNTPDDKTSDKTFTEPLTAQDEQNLMMLATSLAEISGT